MKALLVVADAERSDKTICLAVSPALKKMGVRNRCRLFEVPKNVPITIAPPRMQRYIDCAADIYGVYLQYISKDDIHVYSIDECFIDVTTYLPLYKKTPKEMAVMLMDEVYKKVGIRATCGIGTNMYLAKIALDITAKHAADFIGILDEEEFRRTMWDHRPLTDFWRIGAGTEARLAKMGITTMRDIAAVNEDILYRAFGIDAELLIDHAWGRETTTMADIKAYKTSSASLSSGQVLMRDYSTDEARLIVKEMTENLCLSLVEQGLAVSNISLWIMYDRASGISPSKGAKTLDVPTSSERVLRGEMTALYDKIVVPRHKIRKLNIGFNRLVQDGGEQLCLTDNPAEREREHQLQQTVIDIKQRFGKNALFKGMDLEQAATARERNGQIGGHKSGGQT